jgi:hypothetical protein
MVAQFEERGLRFRYPASWKLEREETEEGWTVSIQSPDTAFILICVREDMPAVEDLAESAVDAFRQEYKDVEVEDCVDQIGGQPALGHEIHFFSFDLTNTCWTRSFYSGAGTVLVMCQANDMDLETHGPVMRAICASLEVEE